MKPPRAGTPLALSLPLAVIVLTIVVLAIADFSVYVGLRSFMVSRIDEQLVQLADVAPQLLVKPVRGDDDDDHDGTLEPISDARIAIPGAVAAVRLPGGVVSWAAAPDAIQSNPNSLLAAAGTLEPNTPSTMTIDGEAMRVIETSSQQLPVAVMLPMEPVEEATESLVKLEAIIGAIAVLILGLGTFALVRRGLRPLNRMSHAAQAISRADLVGGARKEIPSVRASGDPAELAQLGDSFDTMTEHINTSLEVRDESETKLRRFIADASHELRTPLQSIRGYAELARRDMVSAEDRPHIAGRIEDEAIRMGGIVDDLLLLARLDQGRPLERQELDVALVIRDVVSDSLAADPARPVSMDVHPEEMPIIGDANRLHQVLVNLVTNARVHTPDGTGISVLARQDDTTTTITVADTGPGIAQDVQLRLFDRFYRSDSGRSRDRGGSGLGLAIVKSVVEAHGGSVTVASDSAGTVFTITLPNT